MICLIFKIHSSSDIIIFLNRAWYDSKRSCMFFLHLLKQEQQQRFVMTPSPVVFLAFWRFIRHALHSYKCYFFKIFPLNLINFACEWSIMIKLRKTKMYLNRKLNKAHTICVQASHCKFATFCHLSPHCLMASQLQYFSQNWFDLVENQHEYTHLHTLHE